MWYTISFLRTSSLNLSNIPMKAILNKPTIMLMNSKSWSDLRMHTVRMQNVYPYCGDLILEMTLREITMKYICALTAATIMAIVIPLTTFCHTGSSIYTPWRSRKDNGWVYSL